MHICYLFVDADGTENISNYKPTRHPTEEFWVIIKQTPLEAHKVVAETVCYDCITEVPQGTIKALFGLNITWKDEPIKVDWDKKIQLKLESKE